MSIKDFYYGLENKWYALLDKIDAKLPVYKIIEPIDKVIPSFLLFIILLVAVVVFLALPLLGVFGGQEYSVSFMVSDYATKDPIANATVTLSYADKIWPMKTDAEGKTEALKLAKDTAIEYSITYSGYKEKTGSLTLDADYLELPILLAAEGPIEFEGVGEEINFTIQTTDGEKVTDPVKVEFMCTNADAEAPATQTVTNGEVTVYKPENCGDLKYKVSAEGYTSDGYWTTAVNGGTAFLDKKIEDFGSVTVYLNFESKPVSDPMWVEIYKTDDGFSEGEGEYVDSKYGENGQVIFESVASGTYFVKTKGTDVFASSASETFTLAEGENKTITINLKQAILGSIKVHVKSKSFGFNVKDAAVTLKKNKTTIETHYTAENGDIEAFKVGEDTTYNLVISHPDYCIKKVTDVKIKEETYLVQLESGQGCKTQLHVKVMDSEGKAVTNAHVGLYTVDGYSAGLPQIITDINGEAKFTTSEYTTYKIFAYKGSTSGWSDALQFTAENSEEQVYTVVLDIPNGTVKVIAVDEYEKPLQFANVTFRDTFDNKIIGNGSKPIENAEGTLSVTLKADKSVYAIVEKENYSTFISQPVEVLGNGEVEIKAILTPNIVGGDITWKEKGVEFVGLFKDKDRVLDITNGQIYKARFKIKVPKDVSYKTLGFHLRAGKEGISNKLETDPVQIISFNAPNSSYAFKGTSYNPPASQEDDLKYKSEGAAKWITVEWNNVSANSIVNVEFDVEVKNEAIFGDAVLLDWRAYAITTEGTLVSVPDDKSVIAGSNAYLTKELLYANTNTEKFIVGIEKVCSEKWCFSAFITDKSTNLMENASEGYQTKVGTQYVLEFKIIDNSESEMDSYYKSEMQIKDATESLEMSSYKITGAQGTSTANTDAKFDTGKVPVGDVFPNSQITGTIVFTPKKTGATPLTFYITSGKKNVFEEIVNLATSADNEFKLEYENDSSYTEASPLLPSGKSNELVVKAKNAVSDLEVSDAVVSIKDKYGAILSQSQTNMLGIVKMKLPAMQPAEKIKIIAEKANYKVYSAELTVDNAVISVSPSALTYNLNPKTEAEKTATFTISNKTEMDMIIQKVELSGTFYDLIDTGAVEDYLLTELKGKKLLGKGYETVSLPVKLSTIGLKTDKARSVDGKLKVTVSAFGKEWIQALDVKVSIGLGGEADNANCFSINKAEWTGATEGAPRSLEIKIENNCTTKGIAITLDNLQATVDWKTNHIGVFELKLGEDTIDLSSGYYKLIKPKMEKGEIVTGVLTFTPDGGVIGTAEATVKIKAENFVDAGVQELEKLLTVKMAVTNLEDCVTFSQDLIKTKIGTDTTFSIETKNCGTKVEFQLKTALDTDAKEFSMQGTDKKDVKIYTSKEQYAGQYPINVLVKGLEKTEFEPRKMIRVRIIGGDCYEISKYEMDIYYDAEKAKTDPKLTGYDIIKVRNKCYESQVEFIRHYDTSCSWNLFTADAWRDLSCGWPSTLLGAGVGFTVGLLGAVGQGASVGGALGFTCDKDSDCKQGEKCLNEQCASPTDYAAGIKAGAGADGTKILTISPKCNAQQIAMTACVTTAKGTCTANNCTVNISNKQFIVMANCITNAEKIKCPKETIVCSANLTCAIEGLAAACYDGKCNAEGTKCELTFKDERCGEGKICKEGMCIEKTTSTGTATLAIPPITGNYGQGNAGGMGMGGLGGFGSIGGGVMSAANGIMGLIGSGFTNPWVGMGLGALTGLLTAVFNTDSGDITEQLILKEIPFTADEITAMKEDHEYNGELLKEGHILLLQTKETELAKCKTNADCAQGQTCTAEKCTTSAPTSVTCTTNTECSAGQTCTSGTCTETATTPDLTESEQLEPAFEGAKFELVNSSILPNPEKPGTFMEEFEYKITNDSGLKQKDQYTPIFAVVSTGGKDTRAKYCKKVAESETGNCKEDDLHSKRKLKTDDAAVEKGQAYLEKFRIQLNAFEPALAQPKEVEVLPCTIGTMTGKTGPNAMPKLLFEWDFTKIKQNACDEKNTTYAYCDSVQFSTELVKKLKSIDELLSGRGTLKCPTATGVATHVTSELSAYDKDVALTDMFISKESANQIKVRVSLAENGHNTEMWAKVQITKTDKGNATGKTVETIDTNFTSLGSIEKVYTLEEGTYDIKASLVDWGLTVAGKKCTTLDCEAKCGKPCKNADTTNDELSAQIIMNSTSEEGLAKCEPYSTDRLNEFANVNTDLTPVIELTGFYAHLMNDGYSEDFKKDFVEYLQNGFFTGMDEKQKDILTKYFSDNERFKFESPMLKAPYNHLDSGKYKVTISIAYAKDNPWELFDGTRQPTANIVVKLERLSNPSPDSPFYYMPVDGIVGKNTDNGRQGYGVNYFQPETVAPEKTILINNLNITKKYAVIAQDIPGSNPVTKVNVARYDDFALMNNIFRGIVLSVDRSNVNEPSIKFYPSLAAPAVLKVTGGDMEKAYAYYSLMLDEQPQEPGDHLATWSAFGSHCKDFEGVELMERWPVGGAPDFKGTVQRADACSKGTAASDYGVEWCNIKRKGSLYLGTVFFIPQASKDSALLKIRAEHNTDQSVFVYPDNTETGQMSLKPVDVTNINSIEKLVSLIADQKICVSGYNNPSQVKFFWNPQVIITEKYTDLLENVDKGGSVGGCIKQ